MARIPCGAKARSNAGQPCRQPAMPNGRCRFHGGRSTGPRTLKAGGRYSQGLGRLCARFDELLQVDDLLDLSQTLALHDLATNLLLDRGLRHKDTPLFRKRAVELLGKVFTAQAGDGSRLGAGVHAALDELKIHLEDGSTADQAVAEAVAIANVRSQRAKDALDIGLKSERAVSEQKVQLLLGLFAQVVAANVTPEEFARVKVAWRMEAARLANRLPVQVAALPAGETVPAGA